MESRPAERTKEGSFSPDSESSMKIKVRYFGSVRGLTGKSEEEVEIPSNSTVYELLQRLSGIYGETFETEIFQEGASNLKDDLMIAISGTLTEHTSIMRTQMKADDMITLLPIFLGGG